MQALRAQLSKEREKELQKLSTVHQKQLKARAPAPPQREPPQRPHPLSARTRSACPRRGRLTRVGVPRAPTGQGRRVGAGEDAGRGAEG